MVELLCLGDEKMIVQKKTKVPVHPVHVVHIHICTLLGSVTLVYMLHVHVVQITRITKVQKVIFIQPTLVCIFHARLSLDSFSFSILLFLPF
jgi:hypothetical protein